jgi:hypothetical protein
VRIVAIVAIAGSALGLAGCFSKPDRPGGDDTPPGDAPPPADGWLDGYGFRKRVDVMPPTSTRLTDFPIAIATNDDDIAAHALGSDLVATGPDGVTPLASELVARNGNRFELWVDLPELTGPAAIYLYYGGPDHASDPATWSSLFAGVWHMSSTTGETDSTGNGNDLTSTGNAVPTRVPGAIGTARQFDGVDDILDAGDPASGDLDFGTGSFSYSLWVRQSVTVGLYDTPFYKGGASAGEHGYCWLLGSEGWYAKLHDGLHKADPELGPAATYKDQWIHLTAVVDRTAGLITAYANDITFTAPLTDFTDLSNTNPFRLGRGSQDPFAGNIDEVRIYRDVLSREWIETEIANGHPGFVTLDAEETAP